MGVPIAILGTTSSHGGVMISASGSTFDLQGRPVCLEGDMHSCPIQGHGVTPIVSGCAQHATDKRIPVAIEGSVAGCGAVLNGAFGERATTS